MRRCGICGKAGIEPVPGKLEQAQGSIAAVVYACECGWIRTEPVTPTVFHTNGWTGSWSPCRRKTDVQPR